MRNNIFIFFILILSLSCSDKSSLSKELIKLKSRTMVLPTSEMITSFVEDSTYKDFSKAELKLIIYIDSTECMSCRIKRLYDWNRLIKLDSRYNGRMKYYFVFCPPKGQVKQTLRSIKLGALKYPIIVDETNKFIKDNPQIPSDIRLHTFLLDKENKVILAGDPLRNKKLRKIFYREVRQRLENDNTE